MTETWKLLAILGSMNLLAGIVVVVVGIVYDFSHVTPGTIALGGMGLMGGPWFAMSKHLYDRLKLQHAKEAASLGTNPRDVVRQLSDTGAHRTLQAIIAEHGGTLPRLGLGEEEGEYKQ